MVKNILTPLLLILFISCGSDDNSNTNPQNDDDQGQGAEKRLSSYTFNNFGDTPEKFVHLFNNDEKIEKEYSGDALPSANYNNYKYFANGKIAFIDLYSSEGEIIEKIYEFSYNETGELIQYITYGAQSFPITTLVSYEDNVMNFVQQETGRTAQIIFEDNKVSSTIHNSGPNEDTRSDLFYDSNGLLSEVKNYINNNLSYTIDFEFSNQENPIYEAYSANETSYLALQIFDMDYTGNYEPYTQKLRSKKTVNGPSGSISEVLSNTFLIDGDDAVTTISVFANEELVNKQEFEYNQ